MKLTNYNPKLTNQTTNTSNTQTLKTKELTFFCLLSSQFVFSDLELLQVWLHVCFSPEVQASPSSQHQGIQGELSPFFLTMSYGENSLKFLFSLCIAQLSQFISSIFFFIIKKIQNQNNGVPLNP